MLTKFVVAFCVLALAAAIAGSIPVKGPTYHVTIVEKASVNGVTLQPGEYKVVVSAGKAWFQMGKETQEVAGVSPLGGRASHLASVGAVFTFFHE